MTVIRHIVTACFVLIAGCMFAAAAYTPTSATASPVLVELFTSEACSSCPPADALLEEMDHTQPFPGTQVIALSEHVDYWNQIGWKDPYSARFFSDRQSAYAQRFALKGPYTPEMVVDGAAEFVGSSPHQAGEAIEKARISPKVPIHISAISIEGSNILRAHIESDSPASSLPKADLWVAIALDKAESQVSGGENDGKRLTHVAVVKSLTKVGTVKAGKGFSGDVKIKLESGTNPANLRVIAFLQEPNLGKVQGAALEMAQK